MNGSPYLPPDVRNQLEQLSLGSRLKVQIAAIFQRLASVFVLLMFSSLFLGFIGFMRSDTGSSVFQWFSIPFYLVFFLIFSIVFQKRIYSDLRDWFPQGRVSRRHSWILAMLSVIPLMVVGHFIGIWYITGGEGDIIFGRWFLGIGSIGALILPLLAAKSIEDGYVDRYKEAVIPHLVKGLKGEITYRAEDHESKPEFTRSQLFVSSGNIISFKGSDRIIGSTGITNYSFSQLHVRVKEVSQSGGKKKVEIKDLFRGIFMNVDFNKSFDGMVVVFPDHARGIFGRSVGETLNTMVNRPDMQSVLLEDSSFEKRFTVMATDKVLARYVLTPKLMERLVELEDRLGYDLSISFIDGHLFLALEYDRDLFRPPIFGPVNNRAHFEKQFGLLHSLTAIPELLDLDTRIWTKA